MPQAWLSDPDLMEQELLNNGIPHHFLDQMARVAEWAVVTHSQARQYHQQKVVQVTKELDRLLALPPMKRPFQQIPDVDRVIQRSVLNARWPATSDLLAKGNQTVEFVRGLLEELNRSEEAPELPTFAGVDPEDGLWLALSLNNLLLIACPPELEKPWTESVRATNQVLAYPLSRQGLDPLRTAHPADHHPCDALRRIAPGPNSAWARLNLLNGASALGSLLLPDLTGAELAS